MHYLRALACITAVLIPVSTALAADGDPKEGEDVFKARCRQCHQVGPDAKNGVGPVLNGIVGRKAGSIDGFSYSPANKKAGEEGWTWTEQNLDKYLADPRAAMPGNRMAFAGLKDDQERADLIAYLKKLAAK